MSGRVRLIVTGVVAFLVCVLFFLFFIRPRQSELSTVNENIEAARNENQQLKVTLDRLQGLRAESAELQATLEQIRGFVPEDDDLPNFIFQVQEAANLAGVGFVQITPDLPKPPPEGAPLAEIRMTINAEGGYFSLQDFVRRLYSLDRAVRIDTLGIGADLGVGGTQETPGTTTTTTTEGEDGGEGDLTLTLTARIFFELPEGGATGTTPAPETTPAPGASPAPTTPAPAPAPTAPTPATTP